MKTYNLTKSILILNYSALSLATLFGVFIAFFYASGPERWFTFFWMACLLWLWYQVLRVPFQIKIREDGSIEFSSPLKRVVLSPEEIKSIKAYPLLAGQVRVRHSTGTLKLFSQMHDFHDFVSTVKSLNSSIEIKGC